MREDAERLSADGSFLVSGAMGRMAELDDGEIKVKREEIW
jgi:hypothetical protein